MTSRRWLLTISFLALIFCAAAWSQDTASITGTITDPSGAAVPNAKIAVTNTEHGINRTSSSNGSGDFLFASLPIGSYDLTVTAQGFKKYQAKGVVLRVAEKARVNVTLEVGTLSTEVIVQGENVAQVETQSSDLGNTVTGKEVTQLELNGRDFTQLVALSPGVTDQSGADEGEPGASTVAFSVNGGRTEYNNFEIDGGDALDNGSNTTLNVYPSIDAIAEVQVLTSNYGAQYGRNGSGTVEVETKSGTNKFHGDLYEFLRNDDFNATPEFFTSPPEYKKNDFGFTIGGPVFIPGHYNKNRQKTFFFWSEEWRRELTPASGFFSTTTVPTMAERGGDFTDQCPAGATPFQTSDSSGFAGGPYNPNCPAASPGATVTDPNTGMPVQLYNPYPGNQVPINNATVTNALSALIPQPNIASGALGNILDSWNEQPTLPTHWRQELFRIDHNISDKVRASFRYIHDSWNQQYPVPLWTSGVSFPTIQTNFNNPGISMVAHLTANVTPTLLNEFVASYTTDHISTSLTGPWQRPSGFGAIGLYNNGYGGKVPGISITGGEFGGGFAEDPGYVPQGPLNANPTFTFRDNVTKISGKHNVQAGFYFVDAHKNEIPQPGYGVNGLLTFDSTNTAVSSGNAFADLLLGNISGFTQEGAALKMHEAYKIYETYFQDDWHVAPRLTLNLGIRFSFYGTYREENNLAWNFDPALFVPGASSVDPSTGLVIGNPYNGWVDCGVTPGVPTGCIKNHWWNPAPRIGFAFDPKGDGKWAIRGGYGIFFEHTNGTEANTESLEYESKSTPITSIPSPLNAASCGGTTGYDCLNSSLLGSAGSTTTPLQFVSIPSKATWPYMQQWHFDIQHDLGKGTVATLSYVGSVGVHLTRTYEYNQMFPVPASINPYAPGEPITTNDCTLNPSTGPPGLPGLYIDPTTGQTQAVGGMTSGGPTTYTGTTTGSWANNLAVACGNNSNSYRPYPGIGSIQRKDQTGSSNYNAMQVSLRHNIGGLELNAAYTYSHSIDDSSDFNDTGFVNSYDLNAYRASSNFDIRHNFTLAYVYDLPIFKAKGLAHTLLGGWQWSGITLIQSGTPFSVYNGGFNATSDNAGVGNGFSTAGSYPDLVSDPRSGASSSALAAQLTGFGPLLYNPAAFVLPTGLTFGDAGRNILRNPRRTNFDMALLKHFPVTESKYFEFRAEAFNVFNHVEYTWLGGDGGSAANNAGRGTDSNEITCYGGANNSAGDPTCAGSAYLRSAGTHFPRIMQLALKFIF